MEKTQSLKAYIGGSFLGADTGDTFDVLNPATGGPVGDAPLLSRSEVQRAAAAAKKAQEEWKEFPSVERGLYIKSIASVMRKYADRLGKILSQEQGKTLPQAMGEVEYSAQLLEFHAEWARRIEGEIVQSDSRRENIMIFKEPLGVVACILPWNFPLYVLARKMGPALITGNTVVLKPSSDTPLCALALAECIDEISPPPGLINVVTGRGSIAGAALAESPDVDFVTVTGSVETGKKIMASCAEGITKVSLELGGKAPAIVMKDADIDLAVQAVVGGRIANAGQVCNCVERVYVDEEIAGEFIKKTKDAMSKVTFGNGMESPDSDMGAMISKEAVQEVHAMVKRAIDAGAKLEVGGEVPDGNGAFYPATLLTDCSNSMEIMRKEIFGPVLPVMTFKTSREALNLANDCEYGLTSTLFTSSYNTVMTFANRIESGELYINRQQGEAFQGFHAGWKHSGIGGDDGRHGMEEYLKTRTVYMKYGD